MNLEGIMLSDISQSQKDKFSTIPHMESVVLGKIIFIETDSRVTVARGLGSEKGGKLFNGYRVCFAR